MMDNFYDLMATQSVVVNIFLLLLIVFLAAVGVTVLILWLWDRFQQPRQPQGPLADFYDSYAETERESKDRMDTLSRPVEAPSGHWIDQLLTKYQLGLEVDTGAGVVRLTDRKHFELKNKVMELPVSRAVGLDEPAAKALLRTARFNFNRRAQRQGIVQVKHRKAAVAA